MAEQIKKKPKPTSVGAKKKAVKDPRVIQWATKKAKSKASAPAKKPYFTYRLDDESKGNKTLVREGEYKFKGLGGLLRHVCTNIGKQKNLRAFIYRSESGEEDDAGCLGWIMYGKLILGGDTRQGVPDDVYVGPVYLHIWDDGAHSYTKDRGYQI